MLEYLTQFFAGFITSFFWDWDDKVKYSHNMFPTLCQDLRKTHVVFILISTITMLFSWMYFFHHFDFDFALVLVPVPRQQAQKAGVKQMLLMLKKALATNVESLSEVKRRNATGHDIDLVNLTVFLESNISTLEDVFPNRTHVQYFYISKSILHKLHIPFFNHSSNMCAELHRSNSAYTPTRYNVTCIQIHFEDAHYELSSRYNLFTDGMKQKKNTSILVTSLQILGNAVLTPYGETFLENAVLVPTGCGQSVKTLKLPNLPRSHEKVFFVTLALGHSYYHAFIEQLCRLSLFLDFLRTNLEIKVHVRKSLIIARYLEYLGIDRTRIITGYVHSKIVFLPRGQACYKPSLLNIQVLSLELRKDIEEQTNTQNSIVILKRSAHFRWIKNYPELLSYLQQLATTNNINLEIFSDKHMPSVNETAKMFNRAFMVIGLHGAGLSNLIFSRPGTVVFEITCYDMHRNLRLNYPNLMSVLGHRYYAFVPEKTTKQACLQVNISKVMTAMTFFVNQWQFTWVNGANQQKTWSLRTKVQVQPTRAKSAWSDHQYQFVKWLTQVHPS